MRSFLVIGGLVLALSGFAPAQKLAAELAKVQKKIDAKEWEAALEMTLGLADKATSDTERDLIGLRLQFLGDASSRAAEFAVALRAHEACLAVRKGLFDDRAHLYLAVGMYNIGYCLASLHRWEEALPKYEASLAACNVLDSGQDTVLAGGNLSEIGLCLLQLGRPDEALPRIEAAVATWHRAFDGRDHPVLASGHNNFAGCLEALGRREEALQHAEAAVAMWRRLHRGEDHRDVAVGIGVVALCLQSLGRTTEALSHCEATLAMRNRLCGNRDHPDVADALSGVATCLQLLGRLEEARVQHVAAVAMWKRLEGGRDHPSLAGALNNLGVCLHALGQSNAALSQGQDALAMKERLFGHRDHPGTAMSLSIVALSLHAAGRTEEALASCERACAMVERLRERKPVSAAPIQFDSQANPVTVNRSLVALETQQSVFDQLKGCQSFERLQLIAAAAGKPDIALQAAERSRGRELLDALEQQRFDPLEEAERRARTRGDDVLLGQLRALRTDLRTEELKSDGLLHELTKLDDLGLDAEERRTRREELIRLSNQASARQRRLIDHRARLLVDVLPIGRVRTAAEVQAVLAEGDLLLEFTVTKEASFLYVVAPAGNVEVLPLPNAMPTVEKSLHHVLHLCSHDQLAAARGRDPDTRSATDADGHAHALFESLIPPGLWPRLQAARRIYVAAHRELHRLPFELLVTGTKDGRPVRWLDDGPAVAYVQSGSALVWLRHRAQAANDDATGFDLLAVGDPSTLATPPQVPEHGAYVLSVDPDGEGARVGIRPRDVIVRYDGESLVDDTTLRDLIAHTKAAIEDGRRPQTRIPLVVSRRGAEVEFAVHARDLDVGFGKGAARAVYEASLRPDNEVTMVTREGDVERLRRLPPLRGARAETRAIEALFRAKQRVTKLLLGPDATEPAVFELAAKAGFLHFACHGIADEYAGQSLSMLILSQPEQVLVEDDGLLKQRDLWNRWRGRLDSCRLVVLSACRTNVGPTLRDEAPQALPLGFLFAGASSVISSLWAVDDASTKELMTDFYGRLLAGEKDRLKALTDAKKELRAKYPDPFHWAPFLYMGSPE